jgi:hypothetical protein
MANKYAYSGQTGIGFDNGINRDGKGLWNRAYATFERVNLGNGPRIGNIAYGNFFGGDMGKKELRNGWKRQFSAYIGYNGSTQDFERQSIDQNGGTLGVMETWYKGNFFPALTANAAASVADLSTMYGSNAMIPRAIEPNRFRWFTILLRYFSVSLPGRTPSMKLPCFCRFSA